MKFNTHILLSNIAVLIVAILSFYFWPEYVDNIFFGVSGLICGYLLLFAANLTSEYRHIRLKDNFKRNKLSVLLPFVTLVVCLGLVAIYYYETGLYRFERLDKLGENISIDITIAILIYTPISGLWLFSISPDSKSTKLVDKLISKCALFHKDMSSVDAKAEIELKEQKFEINNSPFKIQIEEAIKSLDKSYNKAIDDKSSIEKEIDNSYSILKPLSDRVSNLIKRNKELPLVIEAFNSRIAEKRTYLNRYKDYVIINNNSYIINNDGKNSLSKIVNDYSLFEIISKEFNWSYDKESKKLIGKKGDYKIEIEKGYYETKEPDGTKTAYQVDEGERDNRFKSGWRSHKYVTKYHDNCFTFYVGEKGIIKLKQLECFGNVDFEKKYLYFGKAYIDLYKKEINDYLSQIASCESELKSIKKSIDDQYPSYSEKYDNHKLIKEKFEQASLKVDLIKNNKQKLIDIQQLYKPSDSSKFDVARYFASISSFVAELIILIYALTTCGAYFYKTLHPEESEEESVVKSVEERFIEPDVITYNFVDMGTSVLWATSNIGTAYYQKVGNYYAWGDTAVKSSNNWNTYRFNKNNKLTKYCTMSKFGKVDKKKQLELKDDIARIACGDSCRIPTLDEFKELFKVTTSTYHANFDGTGYPVMELESEKTGNKLYFIANGKKRDFVDSLKLCGSYWTSTLNTKEDNRWANFLFFDNVERIIYDNGNRSDGYAIRAVKLKPKSKPKKK